MRLARRYGGTLQQAAVLFHRKESPGQSTILLTCEPQHHATLLPTNRRSSSDGFMISFFLIPSIFRLSLRACCCRDLDKELACTSFVHAGFLIRGLTPALSSRQTSYFQPPSLDIYTLVSSSATSISQTALTLFFLPAFVLTASLTN